TSQLDEKIPRHLPAQAANAAEGSVGGALVAAQTLEHAGLVTPAHQLSSAASDAFIHSLNGTYPILGGIAIAGPLLPPLLLPPPPRPQPPPAPHRPPASPPEPVADPPVVTAGRSN